MCFFPDVSIMAVSLLLLRCDRLVCVEHHTTSGLCIENLKVHVKDLPEGYNPSSKVATGLAECRNQRVQFAVSVPEQRWCTSALVSKRRERKQKQSSANSDSDTQKHLLSIYLAHRTFPSPSNLQREDLGGLHFAAESEAGCVIINRRNNRAVDVGKASLNESDAPSVK